VVHKSDVVPAEDEGGEFYGTARVSGGPGWARVGRTGRGVVVLGRGLGAGAERRQRRGGQELAHLGPHLTRSDNPTTTGAKSGGSREPRRSEDLGRGCSGERACAHQAYVSSWCCRYRNPARLGVIDGSDWAPPGSAVFGA